MSAGPYLTHQLNLSSAPRAMLALAGGPSADARVFLATADQSLSVVDFPGQTSDARILAQIPLAGTAVKMAHANDRLLLSLADGRLQWLDVKVATNPKVLAILPSPGKLLDLQLDAEAAYLLLAAEAGKLRLQRWILSEGQLPQQDHVGRAISWLLMGVTGGLGLDLCAKELLQTYSLQEFVLMRSIVGVAIFLALALCWSAPDDDIWLHQWRA